MEFDASIVISTERSCWPDKKLADRYPTVDLDGYRFINSGGLFMLRVTFKFHQTSETIQTKIKMHDCCMLLMLLLIIDQV